MLNQQIQHAVQMVAQWFATLSRILNEAADFVRRLLNNLKP